MCVTSEGKVYTWGCNDEGALGRVTDDEDETFCTGDAVQVNGKVVQVCAGDSHTAALTDDGRLFTWGIFRVSVIITFSTSISLTVGLYGFAIFI